MCNFVDDNAVLPPIRILKPVFLMSAWLIWLIAAVILLIVEILTQSMWSLCLTIGCAAAMIVSFFGLGIDWQVGVLTVGTVAAYLILLPVFRRRHEAYVQASAENSRTGMDALLGRNAIVTQEIRPGETGRARIDGDSWQVRAPGCDTVIPRGTEVTVTGYDSIILTVNPNN